MQPSFCEMVIMENHATTLQSVVRLHFLRALKEHYSSSMIETKMAHLVKDFQLRHKDTLKDLAECIERGQHFIEFTVLELNERLFDNYASWQFMVALLALVETLVSRAYNGVKKYGIDAQFKDHVINQYSHNVQYYLDCVWTPWIKEHSEGWTYFMVSFTNGPEWLERRLLKKFYWTMRNARDA